MQPKSQQYCIRNAASAIYEPEQRGWCGLPQGQWWKNLKCRSPGAIGLVCSIYQDVILHEGPQQSACASVPSYVPPYRD
eukprot:6491235-Amphidinium_carterae.1